MNIKSARTNVGKDENSDLLADSHNISIRQNVNLHIVSNGNTNN
jgi:hypothetical protein